MEAAAHLEADAALPAPSLVLAGPDPMKSNSIFQELEESKCLDAFILISHSHYPEVESLDNSFRYL